MQILTIPICVNLLSLSFSLHLGRPECWQAIRVAVEASECGHDLASLQTILESADMSALDTDRIGYCFTYDSKGFKYEIPLYCIFQPTNIVNESSQPQPKQSTHSPNTPLQVQPATKKVATQNEEQVEAETDAQAGKMIKFKIRFSNGKKG